MPDSREGMQRRPGPATPHACMSCRSIIPFILDRIVGCNAMQASMYVAGSLSTSPRKKVDPTPSRSRMHEHHHRPRPGMRRSPPAICCRATCRLLHACMHIRWVSPHGTGRVVALAPRTRRVHQISFSHALSCCWSAGPHPSPSMHMCILILYPANI